MTMKLMTMLPFLPFFFLAVFIEFLTEFGDLPLLKADTKLIQNIGTSIKGYKNDYVMNITEYRKGKMSMNYVMMISYIITSYIISYTSCHTSHHTLYHTSLHTSHHTSHHTSLHTSSGTKEDLECSGQGICDEHRGICSCFDGFGSSNGTVSYPGQW
jgi:hypothetical protein